ncbi:hypothetical protein [Jiangella endophytica]|uniref:hypothetical protein n=1 Tax=Jiangella endophytica TaxID=1623398 RepID=UPI001300345C|nr:hypothetical protein [Jiangella endophytica]
MDRPLNRAELSERFPDPDWRERFLELLSIVTILRESIITRAYKPTETLNNSIALSAAGKRVRSQLATKESVNAKDGNVLTFLALAHAELLVDVEAIDIERLVDAISEEIRAGSLKYPLRFGRQLYDRFAELFPDEREYLGHDDTIRLLEGTPQGVFQSGRYVLGPFGLFRCDHSRSLYPTTAPPLQHCADSSCKSVHRIQLSTSVEAGVNRSRPALNKVLNQTSAEPSAWSGFVADIIDSESNPYELDGSNTIPYLLGDAFSDNELRILTCHAEKESRGALPQAARRLGLSSRAEDYTAPLDRAQLLQLLFLLDNTTLREIVDSAVRNSVINVSAGEVRRPRVNTSTRTGAWNLRPQLSRLGMREVGADSALPLLRLSMHARELFNIESAQDMDDLTWILREVDGDTPYRRLEEFLRTAEPPRVVDALIFARRSNAIRVCSALNVPVHQADSDIRDGILWKLGFPLPKTIDLRDRYWGLHDDLEAIATTANVDLSATAEGLRAAASDYFVCLERFLFDSLVFAAWALLNDHYTSDQPYVYLPQAARRFAITALGDMPEGATGELTDEPVLSQVVEGFSRLAKLLKKLREEESQHVRDRAERPKFSDKTSLQKFPFQHTKPFLDLLAESQVQLIEVLSEVAGDLNASGIMTARNGLLHAKTRVPTIGEVTELLARARKALDSLEKIGCVRSTFSMASSSVDRWGHATTTLRSGDRTISFSSPSSYEWLGLPDLRGRQYLVHGALFAAPNEMLRFSEGFETEFQEYWQYFPRRPQPGSRVGSNESESLATPLEAGTHTTSRAG